MDFFREQLNELGKKVSENMQDKSLLGNEQATINTFVLPFIQALGYDIFNYKEVASQFVADVPGKLGEKVDYAILKDGQPIMLIECKCCGDNLHQHNPQLTHYFNAIVICKFGVLTNGVQYKFYTDLKTPNIMDDEPFLEFNIADMKDSTVDELKRFHKGDFDVEIIKSIATMLQRSNKVRAILAEEFSNPSPTFVKFFASKLHAGGRITQGIINECTDTVANSLKEFVEDRIQDRLRKARDIGVNHPPEPPPGGEKATGEVETGAIESTVKEIAKEGFYVVKSILRGEIDPGRVSYKPHHSFISVVLDDSQNRRICRLWLNGDKRYISLFEGGKEKKTEIADIDDIYRYSQALLDTARRYKKKAAKETPEQKTLKEKLAKNTAGRTGPSGEPWIADGKAWHLEQRCSPATKEMLLALDHTIQAEFGIEGRWDQKRYVAYPVKSLNWLSIFTKPHALLLDFLVKAGAFKTEELAKRLGVEKFNTDVSLGEKLSMPSTVIVRNKNRTSDRVTLRTKEDFDIKSEAFMEFMKDAHNAARK